MQKHHRLQLQTARVFPINVDAKASNVNVKIERLYRQSGRVSALSATRTNLDRVAGLYMDKPNAILVANAGNNVTLTTEQATHDETHYKKTKQSDFSKTIGDRPSFMMISRPIFYKDNYAPPATHYHT